MAIECRCPSCGALLRVAAKHAGRKVMCPQCAGIVRVPGDKVPRDKVPGDKVPGDRAPGENADKRLPVARPLDSKAALDDRPSSDAVAPSDSVTKPSPATTSNPTGSSDDRLPNIVVAPREVSLADGQNRRGQGSRPKAPIIPLVLVAVAAAFFTLLAGYIFWGNAHRRAANRDLAILVLDWPADERHDAAVYIDSKRRGLAENGPLEFRLRPGDHDIIMLRRGYERIEQTVSLKAGGSETRRPRWIRLPPKSEEDDTPPEAKKAWLEDFEVAQRRAAAEHKDVLLFFEQLSGNRATGRIREELLSQREFRQQIAWRFVLVSIELPKPPKDEPPEVEPPEDEPPKDEEPKTDEPKTDEPETETPKSQTPETVAQKAEEPESTEEPETSADRLLAERFHLDEFPAMVLTDAEGVPYAIERVSNWRSVDSFVARLARWQGVREQRDALFLRVEKAEDDDKLAAIEAAVSLLDDMSLAVFYETTLDQWRAVVEAQDPDNAKGAQEALFEVSWMARLAALDEEQVDQINATIAELDDWKSRHEFKDPDRAALMHLHAAARLIETDQHDEAEKYVDLARDYEPQNLQTVIVLAQIESILGRGGGGTGTGFAVAAGGYLLTNHHVIEGNRTTSVRLPDREDLVPATVVADDPERDIALLKIELPEGVEMRPLRIAGEEIGRGAGVGAFGFPGGEAIGTGLKLTIGIVSAVPEQNDENMYLLDCRVNPGNSGGPLCDTHGNVVGMVTAKIGGYGVDSYGMALPGADLDAFLKKHLPEYQPPPLAALDTARLEWDEIDRLVSPSVVMIIGK